MTTTLPILIDLPERLESARLLLRIPLPGDGPELNAAVVESLDSLSPWMEWAQRAPTLDESEANVRQAHLDFLGRRSLRFHLYRKDTSTLVGCAGLERIDWRVPRFEIGYWCRTSKQGRGFTTEAAGALANLAFDQLGAARVEIRVDPRNAASLAIPPKLGFVHEATLVSEALDGRGALRDTAIFARLKERG